MSTYKFLSRWSYGNNVISVPISGITTQINDKRKRLQKYKIPETKLPLKNKHLDASKRIADCTGFLGTLTYRLTIDFKDKIFANKRMDWEVFINLQYILLDSVSILVPSLYGINERYERKSTCGCVKCKKHKIGTINNFRNLSDWLKYHNIDDQFSKEYKTYKDKSYKKLDTYRNKFIHGFKSQDILRRADFNIWSKQLGEKEDKLIFINRKKSQDWFTPLNASNTSSISEEIEKQLCSVFNFLAFCEEFFIQKLKEQNISVKKDMCIASGENIGFLNQILFNKSKQ